jgi:hypothetical protein
MNGERRERSLPLLRQWQREIRQRLPELTAPQARVLAEYSLGIVRGGSAGLSSVAFVMAQWLGQAFATVRERLRDWYRDADRKTGRTGKRKELQVQRCFAPLLRWVLRFWPERTPLALALDATSLGDRFVVLSVSVLFCSIALPVAWRILPAGQEQPWRPIWLQLLDAVHPAVPAEQRVLVLADRGLYARWLYRHIVDLSWHPMLRINAANADFRPQAGRCRPLSGLLREQARYAAAGRIFRSAQSVQQCTLLGMRIKGYRDPWWVLTDLSPEEAQVCWYGLRSWIERGFKFFKSDGWQWQQTRMEDATHAERLWLAMTLASIYLLRSDPQQVISTGQTPMTTASPAAQRRAQVPPGRESSGRADSRPKPQRRILSLFRAGLLLAQLLLGAQVRLPDEPTLPLTPWPNHPEPSLLNSS